MVYAVWELLEHQTLSTGNFRWSPKAKGVGHCVFTVFASFEEWLGRLSGRKGTEPWNLWWQGIRLLDCKLAYRNHRGGLAGISLKAGPTGLKHL
jgi:hypothetical protein